MKREQRDVNVTSRGIYEDLKNMRDVREWKLVKKEEVKNEGK